MLTTKAYETEDELEIIEQNIIGDKYEFSIWNEPLVLRSITVTSEDINASITLLSNYVICVM